MRTNNFSKKQNALKAVALVTLLLTCFVFAFAMTYTLIDFGENSAVDTALAGTGTLYGGNTTVYGDRGNFQTTSELGFKGLTQDGSNYVWSYTESFAEQTLTTAAKTILVQNDSSSGLKTYSHSVTGGTGTFSWQVDSGSYSNTELGVIHYQVPAAIKNLAGAVTVTATISASVTTSDSGNVTPGYGLSAASGKVSSLSGFYQEGSCKQYTSKTTTITSSSTYLILGFWSYCNNSLFSQHENVASVSNIAVTFSVSLTSAQASSKSVEAFGDNKIVAQSLYEQGVNDTFAPYRTTTDQSTWPVWYDSIKNNLSSAVDSVSGGQGTLQSYTSTSLGTIGGRAYYKTSKVTYVGTYAYAFPATASSYSGTDANTSFAVGVKTVQVGSEDSTTDGDGKGAVFDVTTMSNGGSSSKAVYVENELVGYATVKRVTRAKVEVTTYVYKNTDITTKVLDTSYTASASSFKISYKGIDTTAPNRLDVDSEEATSVIGNVSTINWWRNRVLTLETSVDDETEDAYAPYVWFYEVKRYNTLADLNSDTSGAKYSNYSQIKDAGIEPFAFSSVGQLSSFEYNFATGKATGINSAQIAGGVNATKSGYYRFIFYAVDLAGNAIATSTYYVKADYDKPTFDTHIRFEYPENSGLWTRITNEGEGSDLKNGAWALGDTQVVVQLIYDETTKSYINDNGTNISGNTIVFDAGSDVFAVVVDKDKIVKIIEGSTSTAINAATATFTKKVETDAGALTLAVDYDKDYGILIFRFPDGKDQSGNYPDIDWTTSFTMYAGQDYENDGEVYASDGWTGGVKVRVDRNAPVTPELLDDPDAYEKSYIFGLSRLSTDISSRTWFTESGLKLSSIINFSDNLLELYSSEVRVYYAIATVAKDDDFTSGTYTLAYFAEHYKEIAVDDYALYFADANHLGYFDGKHFDEGVASVTLNLQQTDGAGMRAIFMWAVDQAGNVSPELVKYYVLADESTYTISSSVKENANLPTGSAVISQTNADGDNAMSFKRGEEVTFTIEMDTDIYAPYLFTLAKSEKSNDDPLEYTSTKQRLLVNYTPSSVWTVADNFRKNLTVEGENSLTIKYLVDDFTTLGPLDTIKKLKDASYNDTKTLPFEFAHRKIVTYTVTNNTSVPFTYAPTVVEMSTDEVAASAFEYYYLDKNGNEFAAGLAGNENVPVYPNEDGESYFVAIYIPSNNDSFAVRHSNNTPKSSESADKEISGDSGNYVLNFGYQTVKFIPYTIVKGSLTVTATPSNSTYGDAVTPTYTVGGLESESANKLVVKLKLETSETDYTKLGVGAYQIVPDGAEYGLPNSYISVSEGEDFLKYYNIRYISDFHTIYTRKVTISTVADSKVYGEADPIFKFSVALSEFGGNSEALLSFFSAFENYTESAGVYTFESNGIIKRAGNENVGYYAYTVNSAAFDVDTNYSIEFVNTAQFSITQRTIVLGVGGQSIVKKAFDPSVDYATIVPMYTLESQDAKFADLITGSLALSSSYTDISAGLVEYDNGYEFTITLGTIANTSNIAFELSADKTYTVYVLADSVVLKLRSGEAFSFVFGTTWSSSSTITYSQAMFEGFANNDDDYEVNWTATIDGKADGALLDAGSYLVTFKVNSASKGGVAITEKVFVEPFSITIVPAVVKVRPTWSTLSKPYGGQENAFGIGWEIVSVNGETPSDYAGYSLTSIKEQISGSYARALFENGAFVAYGTRYDDASDVNGVLYSNAARYYAFAVDNEFVISNPNFAVDSSLSAQDAAERFEITKKTIEINSSMLTGLSKVADTTTAVNYELADKTLLELRDLLVLSTDDVQLAFEDAAYGTATVPSGTYVDTDITFTNLYLKGAKAANYLLVVTDAVDGKVTISYINNVTKDEHIRLISGYVGIRRSDVSVTKEYDGTTALGIENVIIQNRIENGVGTSILRGIIANGKASVIGSYSGKEVSSAYTLSLELIFKVDNKDDVYLYDYGEDGLRIEKTTIEGSDAIRVVISGIAASITKRVINSKSFVSIAPVSRDYNRGKTVEVEYLFADGAIVSGDDVKLTLSAKITTVDVGVGEHPVAFTSGVVGNSNYIVDVDELNTKYNEYNPLKVTITPAKLIPDVTFVEREYNGSPKVDVANTESKKFTTLHYAGELSSELEKLSFDKDAVEYILSSGGKEDENVRIDGDGNVIAHDLIVRGLSIASTDDSILANYEIYGFRYNASDNTYSKVGSAKTGLVEDFELLDAVLISKRRVSILENDIDVQSKVYDGTKAAEATIDVQKLDEGMADDEKRIVPKDKDFLIITASGEFEQKFVNLIVNVKIHDIMLGVTDKEHEYLLRNYDVSSASDVTITRAIYERPVTFSFTLGARTYSGDPYVSVNVISATINGLLDVDKKSYGIQVSGGAFFMDKNVAYEQVNAEDYLGKDVASGSLFKLDGEYFVALTNNELEKVKEGTFEDAIYAIGAKQGTVYNPIIKNTKAVYTNYVLTYAVDAADYDGEEYLVCETTDGAMLHAGNPLIATSTIKTYYCAIKATGKYILVEDSAKLAAAKTANALVGFYRADGKDAYLVNADYAGEITDTLKDTNGNDISVTYSQDAYGKINKRAAIISDVTKLQDEKFTKNYDGTTKFYGVEGVDYNYSSAGIGLSGDELTIEGVTAEFENASVGDTYVVIRADKLGGKDANNYTYGTLRSARVPACINKIKINASLADDEMVYGTALANVEGHITYTIGENEYLLDMTPNGIMVKLDEFLVAVELLEEGKTYADLEADDIKFMEDLLKRIYVKDAEGNYSENPVTFDKTSGEEYYVRLGGAFTSLPRTNPVFMSARPSAGTESTSYTLKGGEAANYEFAFKYTDGTTSHLTVVKKPLYVVAAVEDFRMEYGGTMPAITFNYLDDNGRQSIISGETWKNVFMQNGVDYRPDVYFTTFENGVSDLARITPTAKVNDGNDPSFHGDYVLVFEPKEGFDASKSNYDVFCGTIELVNADGAKNERYVYTFPGTYTAKAPELTIYKPTISGISLVASDNGKYTTTYNRRSQHGVAIVGAKDTDSIAMYDANGNELPVINAGTYTGYIELSRPVDASYYDGDGNFVQDNNNYSLVWRSDLDGGVESITIEIGKASPGLNAPRDSITYDGKAHTYSYTKATVDDDLSGEAEYFNARYMKKVEGNYVPVENMVDAGTYLVYLTYDPGNPNYEVQTIEIQFAITKASVVVELSYTERQLYEQGKAYAVDFTLKSVTPETIPALLTDNDLMLQFLLAGEGLLKLDASGNVVPIDESVIKIENGKYVFGNSGRYPFQVILKDSSKKDNFDISQNVAMSGKTVSTNATGVLELVVTSMQYTKDTDVVASIEVKQSGEGLDNLLLADKFEARYVYQNNTLADDDAYYAAVDSKFMDEIANALGTSVTISTIIRYNLTLGGNAVGLGNTPTAVSVQLTQDVLNNLDRTVIYQTVLNSDGSTALKKLNGYEIKDGVLSYTTDNLGSLVFVEAGRKTPMLAVWIGVAVAGGIVLIVGLTTLYMVMKRKRLKKELLG